MLEPQRGQKLRMPTSLDRRKVGGTVQVTEPAGKWAKLWYGPPESFLHWVQWQLTMESGRRVLVYWTCLQAQLPVRMIGFDGGGDAISNGYVCVCSKAYA